MNRKNLTFRIARRFHLEDGTSSWLTALTDARSQTDVHRMPLNHSGLTTIRVQRVSLVDELEGRIDFLLDVLVDRELFTRDDREEVSCLPGPRARVRRVLDILECKGEEAAVVFLSVTSHLQEGQSRFKENGDQTQSEGM